MAKPTTKNGLTFVPKTGATNASQTNSTRTINSNTKTGAKDLARTVSAPNNSMPGLVYLDDDIKYYMTLYMSDYSREDLMVVGNKVNTTDAITLPLPLNLVNAMTVDYQEEASSMIGQILLGSNPVGAPNEASASGLFAAGGSLAGITAAKATGYAPNQWMVVLLKGPKYKTFEFSWKLSPKSDTESKKLKDIILKLNKAMAPNLDYGDLLFTFPKIFNIAFYPNHKYLYRFKPAVMNNFVVNYAGGGMPMFYGKTGAPESVELRMSFIEIEYWLGKDFDNDDSEFGNRYYPPRDDRPTPQPASGGRRPANET